MKKNNPPVVMVVEDDPGILEVVKIILEEDGFVVVALGEGTEVEEQIKTKKPDIILIDLWMPGADGEEVVRKLKSQKETKKIPIIVISALADAEKRAQDAGADDFLPKPFNIQDLLLKVKNNL